MRTLFYIAIEVCLIFNHINKILGKDTYLTLATWTFFRARTYFLG